MALILMRHTTPAIETGICYGRTDLDITASFEAEAADALGKIQKIERIVTSPLKRCRKLAEFIGEQTDLSVTVDEQFIEMDFGRWENRPWSAIPRNEVDEWATSFMSARPHGGESVLQLKSRVTDALGRWKMYSGDTLIVTHAGVIRAALATGETAQDFHYEIGFGDHVILPKNRGVENE